MAKDYQLENEVFRSFRRQIKDDNRYWKFLARVNSKPIFNLLNGIKSPLMKQVKKNGCHFSQCVNTLQVLQEMMNLSDSMRGKYSFGEDYEHSNVSLNVNHLLHNFLEGYESMKIVDLERTGLSIFNMVCSKLYGEEPVHEVSRPEAQHRTNDGNPLVDMLEEWRTKTESGKLRGVTFADFFNGRNAAHVVGNGEGMNLAVNVVDDNGFRLGNPDDEHEAEDELPTDDEENNDEAPEEIDDSHEELYRPNFYREHWWGTSDMPF